MKRNDRLLLLLLAAVVFLCGCTAESAVVSQPYRVTFVAKSTETEFWRSAFAGANAAASEYNMELTVVGPETEEDFQAQNAFIAEAVADGADAIVFSAISYTGNAEAIDAAAAAGLRIVVIDSDVDSQGVDVRIGTDNVQAGRMTGTAVLDAREGTLCIGIVNFSLNSRNGQEREQGLREVLEAEARVTAIHTVNTVANQQAAQAAAAGLMKEHPEINVLVGLNEPLAVGVGLAVDQMDLSGRVQVVGFDTNVVCIDLMRAGAVSALIAQNPYAMGYLGVEKAWELLEGASFDPAVWLDTATTIVDRENMFTPESQKALFAFS